MKRIVVGLIAVGVIVGVVVVITSRLRDPVDVDNKMSVVDGYGKKKHVDRLVATVVSWEPTDGRLAVVVDGIESEYQLEPPRTVIFIPIAGRKNNQVLLVNDQKHEHWSTAFCTGDGVTILFDREEVVSVDNFGNRACGLRG